MLFHALRRFDRCIFLGCALLSLLSSALPSGALDVDKTLAQCRLDVWTTKDGLPPAAIHAMAQTPAGYLWFGTEAGLVRFDGVAFQTFHSRNTPGLKRDEVNALLVTQKGRLWLGTNGSGFGPFEQNRFYPLRTGFADESWSVTNALLEADNGTVWIGGGGDHNLQRMKSGEFQKLPVGYEFVQGFLEDRSGTIWTATRFNGLFGRMADGKEIHLWAEHGLPSSMLSSLALDSDNSLWIGTQDAGLCRYADGKLTTYTKRDGLSSNEIHALCFDREGSLWIGTRGGLDREHDNRFSTFRKIDGLHDVGVSAIFEDREGNLWVGSGSGLNRFSNTKLTPLSFPVTEGAANLSGMAEGPDGSLWFASDYGLKRFQNGIVTTYTVQNGLPSNAIVSVHMAKDGALWIITAGGGVTRRVGERFLPVSAQSPWRVIGEDKEGLVFANENDYARLSGGKFLPLPHSGKSGYVFSAYTNSGGHLWFATAGGLATVEHDRVVVSSRGLPPGTHIMSIAETENGSLWLGTDRGLIRLERETATVYGIASGLPSDNLFALAPDAQNVLWIGSPRGIFKVLLADLESYRRGGLKRIPTRLFEAVDGVRSVPNGFLALRTYDRHLVFLGTTGATLVDPDRLTADLPPRVVIERALLDGRVLDTQAMCRLPPGKGDLEVDYTGLDLCDAERVGFRYMLEGYDKSWVDAGTRRVAYYTNLPPGEYRFRVIARNSDGVWNMTGAEFGFKVAPFFYQTNEFKVACAGMLGLSSWGLIRLSLRQLQRRNQRLEEKVAERTEELHRSHEQIEAANRRLQALATTDGMTGLANHRAFQEQLRIELATADSTGRPLSLLLIDVDQFKSYNDTFGHPAGDEVLRGLARLIRENVRVGDYTARYGGEEFAILLPDTTEEAAVEIGERLRIVVAGHNFPCRQVTLSIGVARNEPLPAASETLVARADKALYAAKNGGRNRVVIATQELNEETAPLKRRPSADALHSETQEDPLMTLMQRQEGNILNGIMALLNLRDPGTDAHSHRVARFTLRLAQEAARQKIADLSVEDLCDLVLGALLHDIGKIGVPDSVLLKPGALTEEEWAIIRTHPEQGARVLETFTLFVCALPIVRFHHEKWDGTGYPQGLAGEHIPLGARIFALADTFDAMSSDRPYRATLSYEQIRAEILRLSGVQFDPALVQAFLAIPESEWDELRHLPMGDGLPAHPMLHNVPFSYAT